MGGRVLRFCLIAAAAAGLLGAVPATARVAPFSAEQKLLFDRQQALENAVRARFDDGTFNQLRDMYASVIVATDVHGRPGPPRVLFKNEFGWHELLTRGFRANSGRKLPRALALELDRLMVGGDLWAEKPYATQAPCARPRRFVLRYGGNELFGRQCAALGLAGRVAEAAVALRVPAGRGRTTAPPPGPNDARASLGRQEDQTGQVSNRVREMVYAWDRRSLAGAVDPYAEDAIVQFADGRVLRGRAALVQWLRPQQDWSVLGIATQGRIKGIQYHRGSIKAPVGKRITELREIRWLEDGRPMRRTYSATWQDDHGLWQIVHERVSADKPVTDERIAWP